MTLRANIFVVIFALLISCQEENNVDYQGLWFCPELGFMKFEKSGEVLFSRPNFGNLKELEKVANDNRSYRYSDFLLKANRLRDNCDSSVLLALEHTHDEYFILGVNNKCFKNPKRKCLFQPFSDLYNEVEFDSIRIRLNHDVNQREVFISKSAFDRKANEFNDSFLTLHEQLWLIFHPDVDFFNEHNLNIGIPDKSQLTICIYSDTRNIQKIINNYQLCEFVKPLLGYFYNEFSSSQE